MGNFVLALGSFIANIQVAFGGNLGFIAFIGYNLSFVSIDLVESRVTACLLVISLTHLNLFYLIYLVSLFIIFFI